MKPSKLAVAALLSSSSSAIIASAQDENPVPELISVTEGEGPASRWLTVAEWAKYLESESGTEFDYDEDDPDNEQAQILWDAAMEFEWNRCSAEELTPEARKCVYVVCHASEDDNAETYSGYRRKTELFSALPEEERSAPHLLTTIWNSDTAWCGYGQFKASNALLLGCDDYEGVECVVTPLILSMKMMPDTVARLLDAIEELYGESDFTEKDDGSERRRRRKLARKEERERRERERKLRGLQEAEEEQEEEIGEGGDPVEAENQGGPDSRKPPPLEELPAADFYLAPGSIDQDDMDNFGAEEGAEDASNLDVTKAMTDWLLARTETDDGTTVTRPLSSESIFWTSSLTEDVRSSINSTTVRAQFWADVMEHLGTGACDESFETKLVWTADLRTDDFSVLTVSYNETGGGEEETVVDEWCVLALIASLTSHTDVVAMELKPQLQEHNVNAAWLMQSGLENRFPWFDNGLDGTGQVVAVSDTGIDDNNCYFWDEANPTSIIPDMNRRKIVEYNPYVNDMDYQYGHGTHVAGTIVGQRTNDGGVTESTGTADGVAKGAKVAFIDIGNQAGALYLPSDSVLLATGRHSTNPEEWAHVHSASWGSVGINYYSSQARRFDDYMFDNPDFLINVAAGNDGRGDAYYTVSSPATFKNGLAVGCSHSTGYDLANGMYGPSYIADFSSKGPTADGRMTPMIVAPGKYILSAGALPSSVGECDNGIPDAGGAKAGLKSMAGTSMATPVVSGNAALVNQYFREGWYPTGKKVASDAMSPSAALVKAVLMNGAQTDMNGVDNGRGDVTPVSPYDNIMGFGRLSLIKSLYIEGWADVQAQVWDQELIQDQQKAERIVTIDRSNGCTFTSLSVSLVWVEKASVMGCARCVLNDLDLYVLNAEGTKYFPNGRTSRDDTNNAERVVVYNVPDGANYTVVVEGYNLEDSYQRYALVATGCFGGVKNQLDTSQDAFKTDDSATKRRNNIIITVCSIFGFFLICGLCTWWYKKRQAEKYEERIDEAEKQAAGAGEADEMPPAEVPAAASAGAEDKEVEVEVAPPESPKDAMDNEDDERSA